MGVNSTKRLHLLVRHDVDTSGGNASSGLEFCALAAGQVKQNRFDMLAGAKAVDAEVRAGAGKLAGNQFAEFDLIDHPKKENETLGLFLSV